MLCFLLFIATVVDGIDEGHMQCVGRLCTLALWKEESHSLMGAAPIQHAKMKKSTTLSNIIDYVYSYRLTPHELRREIKPGVKQPCIEGD